MMMVMMMGGGGGARGGGVYCIITWHGMAWLHHSMAALSMAACTPGAHRALSMQHSYLPPPSPLNHSMHMEVQAGTGSHITHRTSTPPCMPHSHMIHDRTHTHSCMESELPRAPCVPDPPNPAPQVHTTAKPRPPKPRTSGPRHCSTPSGLCDCASLQAREDSSPG